MATVTVGSANTISQDVPKRLVVQDVSEDVDPDNDESDIRLLTVDQRRQLRALKKQLGIKHKIKI